MIAVVERMDIFVTRIASACHIWRALAQLMHHHPLVEMGEPLVNIVGGDSER